MQDSKLAYRVGKDLPELGRLIDVSKDSVMVLDQNALDALSPDIARKAIECEQGANCITDENRNLAKGGRNAALQRQALLCAPLSRKATKLAIIGSDGTVTVSDDEKPVELANSWGKSF